MTTSINSVRVRSLKTRILELGINIENGMAVGHSQGVEVEQYQKTIKTDWRLEKN